MELPATAGAKGNKRMLNAHHLTVNCVSTTDMSIQRPPHGPGESIKRIVSNGISFVVKVL